ncbi:MAG: twin-arginine translocase TatA/TatE family subunit [Deltaproteobacteria bacterium]|nr:twin-arginine translocase TatA/TatE family subunit [Deltaproteobacteria bacterium]
MPGFAELVLFLIVVLVIFGAGKLPTIATAIGKTLQNFRKSSKENSNPEPPDARQQSPKDSSD